MIARGKAVGLPRVRFRQEGGQFVQTLPRPRRSRSRAGAQEENFKRGLEKLLSAHLMEMTIPPKTTSQQQRYRTTKKGGQLLARSHAGQEKSE